MSFVMKDDDVLENTMKSGRRLKRHEALHFMARLFMMKKYIKAKVRESNGAIKTNLLGDEIPKENMHYTCTARITIDSAMRMEQMNYPQVYLEECKYRMKKKMKWKLN